MSEFLAYSKEIVSDFLQTAVFLDDRATYGDEQPTQIPANINNPITLESEPNTTNSDGMRTPTDASHILDAKAIIDTFTEKGIVCSVIKCTEEEYERKKSDYIKLMKKADIIVLDWDLFRDDGEYVMTIINELISSDTTLKELRSIVIYTANGLPSIIEKLNAICVNFEFGKYLSNNNPYTTISLFNKPGLSSIEDRKVDFNELVDRCIDEFTETFHGIVPNVAMAAISEVRKNTHKFLGKLNKTLDPAYLSHRSLLETPDEAEEHLEEIIIDEIDSILKTNKIGEHAKFDIIKDANILDGKKYKTLDFKTCIEKGTEKLYIKGSYTTVKKNELTSEVKECFTNIWHGNLEVSKKSETDFAVISSQISNYGMPSHLTLGVIVELDGYKYLCLQPRCDSVRLKKKTDFMFVKLAQNNDIFDVILSDGSKYKLQYGLKNRIYFSFQPSVNGKVLFDDNINQQEDKKFIYIAALKKSHAQRIANEFSAYIARIGLNESEYIRRNSLRTIAGRL